MLRRGVLFYERNMVGFRRSRLKVPCFLELILVATVISDHWVLRQVFARVLLNVLTTPILLKRLQFGVHHGISDSVFYHPTLDLMIAQSVEVADLIWSPFALEG